MAKNLNITTVKLTLNGKEVEWSLQRIRKECEKTELKMKGMTAGSKEWKEEFKKLEALHKAEQDLIPTLERINHYMQEMGKTATTDIGKAIRELTRMRDAMPGDHKDLQQTNNIIEFFKSWQAQNKNLGMTLEKAKQQLTDLVNTPTDKLKNGLAAIQKELAGEADGTQWSNKLKEWEAKYKAQIAINEQGRAGNAAILGADRNAAIAMDSKDRQAAISLMQAEQQRLRQGYMATAGVQGYEVISQEYLDRLHQVNQAVNNLTDAERKYAQSQRDATAEEERKNKVFEIGERYNKKEKVSLEELTEAHKYWQDELKKFAGVNITDQNQLQHIESATKNVEIYARRIKEAKMMLDNIDVHKVAGNLQGSSIDELTAASKKGKEQFSMMKPGAPGYDQLREDLIAIDAELERVTPKWNELAQAQQALAKATDVASRAFSDDKVKLEELTEAQKMLEAQIKKMEGMGLDPNEEAELNRAKMMLDDVNKALDEIAMKDINFDDLDATPTEKLTAALKNLEAQEKRLSGYQESEAEEIARKKAMIQKQLEKNKLAVMDVARAEQIAAHSGSHNVQELKQAYETLQQKLLTLNTNQKQDIARTKEQMAKLKGKIDEVTGAVKTQSTIWQTAVRNITAYVGVFGAFNFIKNKIMQVFESNKQLSDSLANIRKVSGLTGEEINTLYNNIAKIDTRNSVQQLNELAYAGAKLGVQEHGGVAALTGFVRAAEQVQMALGEDLGEDALPALAKLTEVMGLMDQYGVEQAMQKAASAIFMLSTTSTSTGANIVEFSKRLMGLANVSHVTSAELVALGSASDSMGLMAEVSSTAFNKVFTKIQSNTAAIEKAVGVAQGSIKALVDEGKTMEAIVTVFDKMRDMSMEEMQRRGIFTALGSDGARLNNVMTTMADRVDMLKKHLETANKAFEEGEAVIAEYMIQNQTAAAYLERASNAFEKAFTNPEGVDIVTELAKQWHQLSLELTNSTVMMGSMKAALWAVLEVVRGLLYVLPILIQFLLLKGTFAAATQLATGFWNMTKAIWAAVTASKALTAAQKWNGITTALSMAGALLLTVKAALDQVDEAAERARQKQEELDKAFADSKDTIEKSTQKLDEYKAALDKSNLSQDERDKRLRAYMKNEYQPYLDFLGIEIEKVENLADAYAQVTMAIKQKAAAEEKENYRSKVNGENRNNRIAAQAEAIREAKKAGYDIDKKFLDANWEEGSTELYNLVTGGGSDAYVTSRKLTLPKHGTLMRALKAYQQIKAEETRIDKETDRMFNEEYKDLDLEHYSLEEFRKKQLEAQIQREKDRKNTVDLPPSKDELKAQKKAEAEHKQAIRKDLQDAKQESDAIIAKIEEWYRLQETVVTGFAADGKWTQEQAEQMNQQLEMAKNEALANARLAISGRDTQTWEKTKQNIQLLMFDTGEWSQELFQQMMSVSMSAISQNLSRIDKEGGQYGITTSSLKDALDKNAAGNRRKVQELRNKTAKEVEKALLQFNYFEQAAKAYEDRLTQLGLLTETAEQAADRIRKTTGSLKPGGKSEEQLTRERSNARRQAGQQFLTQSAQQNYTVNYENTADLNKWLMDFTGAQAGMGANGFEFQFSGWAEAFKDEFNKWLKDSETYKADIQAFYLSLIDFDKQYFQSVKNYRQKMNENFQQRWETSGKGQAYANVQHELGLQSREQKLTGKDQGSNFSQLAGFQTIGADPEVQASLVRMAQMQAELEDFRKTQEQKKLMGAELQAFQEELAERQRALANEEMATQELLMQKINDHISKLSQWTEPVQQFATEVGDAMGQAIVSGESMSEAMQNALKGLVKSWGESTIQIVKDLMMQQLKQRLVGKTMVKQEKQTQEGISESDEESSRQRLDSQSVLQTGLASLQQTMGQQILATKQTQDQQEMAEEGTKTQGKVMAGIAQMAATVLGSLGPWGAPLIAVFTALLMGLLSAALSALFGGNKSSSSESATKNKVKLASGMLTYDKGNVQETVGQRWRGRNGEYLTDTRQTVIGDDGRVYRAREQRSLPEGVSMVTEPIATRVNGQQALVGERGPEIVIGRKTTRAIQMNRPDLLRDLMLIDRGITTRKIRTFDEGNISDMATAFAGQLPATQQSADGQQTNGQIDTATADALRQLPAAMAAFAQVMTAMQKNGIPAKIQKYGTGGLIDEVQSGLKFVGQYK